MTGSVIRLSSFHYVVIDYVPAAQPEYKVLYMFSIWDHVHKNKHDFWWLLQHFRHFWYENNCSLMFFSVTVSHRSGPNSSWTLVFYNAHWFAPWAEYSLKTVRWYSTCLSDCQIQQRVWPRAALLLLLLPCPQLDTSPVTHESVFCFPKWLALHSMFDQFMHLLRTELMTSVFETYAI